ncbi:(d)CMP kinase [Halorubrum vacuolatum]|uniref:Cytidylate kinase n=1 Tax=Halorubrum vacuolatum TaxID=63740 RepID=A0A238W8T0_HALVU|nr:cytidylate kinase family protein [Halorubrum vacuolatum]SNR42952.1 cytidylate kinase [Halorubrum vacuolatum]
MNIVLSGYPASGTTTLAMRLADRYSFTRIEAGEIVREAAEAHGQSLVAFDQTLCENEELDRELDAKIRSRVAEYNRVILESCYSGHRLDNTALHIWMTAPHKQRIRRFADREGISVAKASERVPSIERSIRFRAREFYGIDIEDRQVYDAVINTGEATVSESFEQLQNLLFEEDLIVKPPSV